MRPAILALFVLAVLAQAASADQISWSNASGGNWNTGSNWTGGIVPGATDTALIELDGTYTVTLDIDATVAGLTIGASSGRQTFSMLSRTFTVDGPLTINTNGKVYVGSSTITGTGSITVSDTLSMITATIDPSIHNSGVVMVAGVANFNAAYTNDPGSMLRLWYNSNWGATVNFSSGFTNNGHIEMVNTYSTSSTRLNSPNGPIVNSPTGTITSTGTSGGCHIQAEFDNQGTVNNDHYLQLNFTGANHTNSGTLNVTGGDFILNQSTTSFTNTGDIVIDSGHIFDVNNNTTFSFDSGTISGEGTLDFSYATVNWVPAYDWEGSLILNYSTLTLSDGMTIQNRTPVVGSTIDGSGNVVVNDTLALRGSTIEIPVHNSGTIMAVVANNFNGGYTNDVGSVLHLWYTSNIGARVNVPAGFTNNGHIEMVNTYSTANTILNCTGGPLINAPTGTILSTRSSGLCYIQAEFDNQGTVDIDHYLQLNFSGANHTNSGSINATGGNLVINSMSSFTNTGDMVIDSGYVLDVNSDVTFNYDSGTITNAGTIDFYQVTASFVPAVNWPGSLTLHSTTLTIADSLILGNPTPMSYSTVGGTGSMSITDTLALLGSTIDVPLHNSGVLSIVTGNTINGTYTNDEGSVMYLWYSSNWGASVSIPDGFTNNGYIEMINTYSIASTVINCTGGPLINSPTGTIQSTGTTGLCYIQAEFDNQGTFDVDRYLQVNFSDANHTNSGTINLNAGNLTINQSGASPSFANSGTIYLDDGRILTVNNGSFENEATGILSGNGSIDLSSGVTSFVNSGTINPGTSPGDLTVIGMDLVQEPSAVINVEIGGTASGEFDSLAVITGSADLGGILNAILYDGYFPTIGDSIVFLTADAIISGFDSLNLQTGGVIFDTASSGGSVSLVCIQADNFDPVIALDSALSFYADGSVEVDLIAASGDAESPDSLLMFGSEVDNDSLIADIDSGIMTLTSQLEYSGDVELIVTVADPQGGSGADTIMVTVYPWDGHVPFTPDANTVALWHFNEDSGDTTYDSSGNGLDGILQNGVAWSSDGRFDGCVSFDYSGTEGQRVYVEDDPLLDTNDELTIDAWIFLLPTSDWSVIASKWYSSSEDPNGQYHFVINDNQRISFTCGYNDQAAYVSCPDSTIPFNRWILVSATFSHGAMVLYMNGEQIAYADAPFTSLTTAEYTHDELNIGDHWTDQHFPYTFDGRIDEVRISDIARYEIVGIEDDPRPVLSDEFALSQNYPDPLRDKTDIRFSLPGCKHVCLKVYDSVGRLVRTLVDEEKPAGQHKVSWNGTDATGTKVSSGVYFYRMEAHTGLGTGTYKATRKMVVVK